MICIWTARCTMASYSVGEGAGKTKKKTLKTYLGNLTKTLACYEMASQVLAYHRFHNAFFFMAMKERENRRKKP